MVGAWYGRKNYSHRILTTNYKTEIFQIRTMFRPRKWVQKARRKHMKIFVSYSRSDAGDFADQIQKHLGIFGQYNVFTDERSIGIGEVWSHTIETNISDCNIFIAIITHGALQSPHVEKEVLQAQTEKKKIVPCFHRYVRKKISNGD